MNPHTGRIHEIADAEIRLGDGSIFKVSPTKAARAAGLVPIPAAEVERVRKLSTAERMAWAERKEARRRQRNARKKERRARRR